jgi:DNA adenine methylase
MCKTFFPYPGGKGKLAPHIISAINRHEFTEYREPFVGGGAIGIHYATESHADCWLNDKDIGIYSLWKAVAEHHHDLTRKVREFVPSVVAFDNLKKFFGNIITTDDPVEIGFNKLAIHKLSFSGLGERGCVKGGKGQSKCQVGMFWSPDQIIEKIQYVHDCFAWRQPFISHTDYSEVIKSGANDAESNVMLYLDPPYYAQGSACYRHYFYDADHVRLSNLLKSTKHEWVLSYDDHWRIRDLYDWADIEVLDVTYCIGRSGMKNKELLITPRRKHTLH